MLLGPRDLRPLQELPELCLCGALEWCQTLSDELLKPEVEFQNIEEAWPTSANDIY